MKSSKLLVAFSAAALLFMGCPYQSSVTLDTKDNAVVDNDLVGKWLEKGSDSYKWKVTLNDDKKTYRIVKKPVKSSDGDPTYYQGYISSFNGQTWLNIYEQGKDDDDNSNGDGAAKQWYIYKLEKHKLETDGGALGIKLYAVTDNITEQFSSQDSLRAFFKRYSTLSFFWNKDDEKTFEKDDD